MSDDNGQQQSSLDLVLGNAFTVLDTELRKDPGTFLSETQPALMVLANAIRMLREELANTTQMVVRSNMMVNVVLRTIPGMQIEIPHKVLVEADTEDTIHMMLDVDQNMHIKVEPKTPPSKIIVPKLRGVPKDVRQN